MYVKYFDISIPQHESDIERNFSSLNFNAEFIIDR